MNSFDFPKANKAVEKELEIFKLILTKYDELEQRIQKLESKMEQYEGF